MIHQIQSSLIVACSFSLLCLCCMRCHEHSQSEYNFTNFQSWLFFLTSMKPAAQFCAWQFLCGCNLIWNSKCTYRLHTNNIYTKRPRDWSYFSIIINQCCAKYTCFSLSHNRVLFTSFFVIYRRFRKSLLCCFQTFYLYESNHFLCRKVVFVQILTVIRQCLHLLHKTQFKLVFKIDTNVTRRQFVFAFFPSVARLLFAQLFGLSFNSKQMDGTCFIRFVKNQCYTYSEFNGERWRKQYNRFLLFVSKNSYGFGWNWNWY